MAAAADVGVGDVFMSMGWLTCVLLPGQKAAAENLATRPEPRDPNGRCLLSIICQARDLPPPANACPSCEFTFAHGWAGSGEELDCFTVCCL